MTMNAFSPNFLPYDHERYAQTNGAITKAKIVRMNQSKPHIKNYMDKEHIPRNEVVIKDTPSIGS